MDRITKTFVNDFLTKNELETKSDSIDFELFCNYTIITKEYAEEFNLEDVSTGKNQGIDGFAIIVNGHLTSTNSEIDDLLDTNKYLEVTFIIIQSKTSDKFEGSEIGNFIFTVKDFFSENPKLPMTEEMKNFLSLSQYIFNNYPKMTRGKPICKLFYITNGKWVEDLSLRAVIDTNIKELVDTGLFERITFEPVDANLIQKYYRKTSEKISAQFNFERFITLPQINGIQESYLGIIPFNEFRKILINDNGRINNIFYDNVRDWLGENPVNKKITETLENKSFDLFTVLNNGITIVAEEKINKANLFTITNFQIVNGCQTSHVLYKSRNLNGIDTVNIPIRLIVTNDENVKNQITLATNRQTEITEEQLAAFSEFQKNLEQYYKSISGTGKLYYERRTGQYNSESEITKTRIVTIKNQIKAFASMFLDKPDLVSGYYGKVYKNVESTIFKEDHKYITYYTSGLAAYVLEYLFRMKNIEARFKKARYHILMLFRRHANPADLPPFNSKRIEEYCQVIINILNSPDAVDYFKFAVSVIEKSGIDINNQKLLYQKNTTELFLRKFNEEINNTSVDENERQNKNPHNIS